MGVKELRQTLAKQRLLFVDTNIIIYLLDNHPRYGDLSATMMEMIETGEVAGVSSILTLAEILTQPARHGDLRAMQDYELYLTHFPNLTLLPVDAAVAREAARLRGLHAFKMPDALQLATANVAGADAILTNDKDWHGKTGSTPLLLLEAWV